MQQFAHALGAGEAAAVEHPVEGAAYGRWGFARREDGHCYFGMESSHGGAFKKGGSLRKPGGQVVSPLNWPLP
jgi:hypothetical protein